MEDLLRRSTVIPVVTLHDADAAVELARAFVRGGIHILELTLRTPAGLKAIESIARNVPEIRVGAGTVRSTADLAAAADAGAAFAVSPGATPELLEAGRRSAIAFLPGIATASELLLGTSRGYRCFKFFPASSCGGPEAVRSLAAPFPEVLFCPTGGITLDSASRYLQLPSVLCVGASWLAPPDRLQSEDWPGIETLAREAVKRLRKS